jgi:hypothetical protein
MRAAPNDVVASKCEFHNVRQTVLLLPVNFGLWTTANSQADRKKGSRAMMSA